MEPEYGVVVPKSQRRKAPLMPGHFGRWSRLGRSGGLLLFILVAEMAVLLVWVMRGTAPAAPHDGGTPGNGHAA